MPFQSEKQRRYLWANEPEIARDWTDTYGSRIQRAKGGPTNYSMQGNARNYLGKQKMVKAPLHWQSGPDHPPTQLAYITQPELDLILKTDFHGSLKDGPNPGPSGIMSLNDPATGRSGSEMSSAETTGSFGPGLASTPESRGIRAGAVAAGARGTRQEQKEAKKMFGKSYVGSGRGPQIGNWASGLAGSKLGGGLGGMLFGPLGMLLGSLFGQGVGRRAYKASQTDEKETAKDILLGQNTLLSNLFSKKKTPTTIGGEGIQTIDIRDKFNRLGDDTYSSIDETIDDYNYDPRVRSLPQRKKFDMKDVSTWYDTHPATGESVMTPGFKERYQGSDKLNPRYIADSYEYMDQSRPEWGTAEATQRPHTFGQEHEWDFFGNPNIKEDDFPSDEEIFKRRFG